MSQNVVPVTLGSPTFRHVDTGTLWMTEARFPPLAELALHAHARPVLAVILDGSWEEDIGGHRHECLPGSVQVEPAGLAHTNRFHQAGARVLVIEPDPARTELLQPCARFLDEPSCFSDSYLAALAGRMALEIAQPDDYSPLALEGYAIEMLARGARSAGSQSARGRPPAWFFRVRDRLHAEFHHTLRLGDLAATAGVHPIQMTRVFRRTTGVSIGTYVRRLRLEWCADKLANSRLSLSIVAHQAGFADQSHFTREFRRHLGVTPRGYRLAMQQTMRDGGESPEQ